MGIYEKTMTENRAGKSKKCQGGSGLGEGSNKPTELYPGRANQGKNQAAFKTWGPGVKENTNAGGMRTKLTGKT